VIIKYEYNAFNSQHGIQTFPSSIRTSFGLYLDLLLRVRFNIVKKILGTTLNNQNSIHEEIKSTFTSGNACYHSVQNLLSSSLLSKNTNIKIYITIILSVVLYGCETWSLTLRDEHRLRVFENRVLRKIFGPKRDGVTEEWRRLHNEELNDLYLSPNIIRVIKFRRMRWAGHVARGGRERCIQGFGGET
jgi:hypothetical protein